MAAPTKAEETRAGVRWVGAGLLLLLGLQVAQQLIDSFDPRLVIKLLVVAGIGLTGLAFEMYRNSGRDWSQPWVIGPTAAAVVLFALVFVLGLTVGIRMPEPPEPLSLEEQVENARAAGERGTRQSIGRERVDFRGSGQQSYVLSFGDEQGTPADRARSDEIQVWDIRGGDLHEALVFEPRLLDGEQALFQFRDIGDIDGDGAEEFVGGYGTSAIRGELLLPFAIDWDTDARRYRLISLSPDPPEFATGARGDDVEGLRAAYRNRLALANRPPNPQSLRLAGYRAQDFTVSRSHQVLVNAYVSDIRPRLNERLVELQPQLFRRTGGAPAVIPCMLDGIETLAAPLPVAASQRFEGALQDFWRKASRGHNCALTGS